MAQVVRRGILRVQCFRCGMWHDGERVSVDLKEYIPFMCNYEFLCGSCGGELISKKTASFIQIAITTIANLSSCAEDSGQFFDVDQDIIPFIEDNWDILCTQRTKSRVWKENLKLKLLNEERIFQASNEDVPKFRLVDMDVMTIGPKRYESRPVVSKLPHKRKFQDVNGDSSMGKKSKSGEPVSRQLVCGYPSDHPFNKDGFSYILAEQDPHSPMDFNPEDLAGKPIPPALYRAVVPNRVLLSLNDTAPQLKVSDDRLSVIGDKGYSMIRASHGVSRGTWFFEVLIKSLPETDGAVRVGWSQANGALQAPCGFDKFSYSWRSKKGTIFHQSKGKSYSDGYSIGDTLGIYIHLPVSEPKLSLPATHKDEALIKFKNFFYYEHKLDADAELFHQTIMGSKIAFYKNGMFQGVAFTDITRGLYYPAISLYKECEVEANFGPNFKYPPDEAYQAMSDCALKLAVEQTLSEMLFHVQRRAKEDPPV